MAVVVTAISDIQKKLRPCRLKSICNMDETCLSVKLLPRNAYIIEAENYKTVRRTKHMSTKVRITVCVWTNSDGSQKRPMAVIEKSRNLRCLRLSPSHVSHFAQENAWSGTPTFKRWFEKVFVPHVRKITSRNFILLMDNCGTHGADVVDPHGWIKFCCYCWTAPACTSRWIRICSLCGRQSTRTRTWRSSSTMSSLTLTGGRLTK